MTKQWTIDLLAADLIARIEKKDLADRNGKLPSEKELMEHYQVSRYSLRQALSAAIFTKFKAEAPMSMIN